MTESEFISQALNDKAFLLEVCKNIPDEMLENKDDQTEKKDPGLEMDDFFYEAAYAMGHDFDQDVFKAEFDRQLNALGGFTKLKFIGRFFRSLAKAGKGKK